VGLVTSTFVTDGYGSVEDNRIKHLEMIQAVVARLANNSFLVKGWAVTVAGAFLGFAVSRSEARLAEIGVLPVLMFWGMDAYFLYAERLFRALYDQVRRSNEDVKPFYMGATSSDFAKILQVGGVSGITFRDAVWRPTVWIFHAGLIAAAVLTAIAISVR
jgi:hypothetical protein